jgi:hypothetical protein
LGHPEVEHILPIQLLENNRKMFLSDLQTVAFWSLKNTTSIADTETFKKAIRPRPPRSLVTPTNLALERFWDLAITGGNVHKEGRTISLNG